MVTRDFQKQSLLGIFVSYFRPHMGLFLLDMACALMISLIDLAFPFFKFLAFFVEKPGQNSAYDYPGAIWDAQQKRRISRGAVSGVTSAQLQGAVVVRNRGTHDI